MDVDGARPPVEVVSPDLSEQAGTRVDPPTVLRQEPEQLELLEGQIERTTVGGDPVGLGVDREWSQADDGAVPRAGAAPEHRQPDRELGIRRAREDELVGDLVPGVAFEVIPVDDHDRGEPGLPLVEVREDGPCLARVLDRIDEDREGVDLQDVRKRQDRQRLVLEVDGEIRQRRKRAVEGTIGKQRPHGHRDVLTIPGRHGRRYA